MVPSSFNLTLSLVRTSQHEAPWELGHCPLCSVEVIKTTRIWAWSLKKSASWFEMRLSKWCFLFSCFVNDVRPFFPKGPVKWTFVESCQVFLSSWTSAESTRNWISWNKCAQSWACHLIFVYFEGVFGGESSQTSSKKRFVANAGIVLEGECAEFGRPGLTFRCWCFKTSHLVLEEHFPEQCLRWRRFEVSLSWQFETTLKQDLNIFLLEFYMALKNLHPLGCRRGPKWNLHYPMSTEVKQCKHHILPTFSSPLMKHLGPEGFWSYIPLRGAPFLVSTLIWTNM